MGRRKLWFALAAAGVIGGLVGIVLTELMHFIQHTAYGYGADGAYISFREGVAQASGMRRVAMLTLCGAIAGGGWWLLKALGKPQIEIKAALKQPLQGAAVSDDGFPCSAANHNGRTRFTARTRSRAARNDCRVRFCRRQAVGFG